MDRWRIASGVSRSSGRDAGICRCGGRLCVGADYRSTDRDAFLSRFGGRGGKRRHQCADAGYLSKGRVFAHDVICHAGHYDSAVNGAHCRGWVLVWLSWHYIFWILAIAAILASVMIFALIKETLPVERRQPFHIRTTIGNFAALFRHKRVLSYMLASGFSFAGMFSFERGAVCLYRN